MLALALAHIRGMSCNLGPVWLGLANCEQSIPPGTATRRGWPHSLGPANGAQEPDSTEARARDQHFYPRHAEPVREPCARTPHLLRFPYI